jgi:hypothetical protein
MQKEKPIIGAGGAYVIVALIIAFTVLGVNIGEDFIIPVVVVGGALAAYLARTEVGRALAHRIRFGRQGQPEELPAEVYAELDELRARVMELEERVDFAERLVAQPREAQKLASGNVEG